MRQDLEEALRLLGVNAHTEGVVIDRAYRRLARATHPDLNDAPDAAQRFAALTAAYHLTRTSRVPSPPANDLGPGITQPTRRPPRTSSSQRSGDGSEDPPVHLGTLPRDLVEGPRAAPTVQWLVAGPVRITASPPGPGRTGARPPAPPATGPGPLPRRW